MNLGLRDNGLLTAGIGAEILLLAALSYVPFLQDVFSTASLSGGDGCFLLLAPLWMFGAEAGKEWLVCKWDQWKGMIKESNNGV